MIKRNIQTSFIATTLLCILSITNTYASSLARTGESGLILGMLPFMSPVALFKRFTPLREYLSQELDEEIVFETAKDFETFIKRTNNKHYDIILTAPHFVNSALDTMDYHLLATVKTPLTANIMVQKNSELKSINDLQGKRISHAPDQAFIPIIGKMFLKESGLTENNSPEFIPYRSHNAAFQAAIAGEVDAVIIGPYLVKNAINNHSLRLLGKSSEFPSIAVLSSNKLSNDFTDKVTKILVNMSKDDDGKQTLKAISCPGFRKASKNEYDVLRNYLSKLN